MNKSLSDFTEQDWKDLEKMFQSIDEMMGQPEWRIEVGGVEVGEFKINQEEG